MTFISKLKSFWLFIFVFIIAGICVALSINISREIGAASDFNVFWTAGYNFMHGNALYSGVGGACRFIYPPFAAWLFRVFAWVPLQTAAATFAIVNFILYFVALYLTRKIFSLYIKDTKYLNISLFFAALLSFRYYWYHFHFIQLNIGVFVLCLAGILSYLKGKQTASAFFFVFATFIKVYPVFFLIWLVIRGTVKTPFMIAAFALLFMFAPMINRGFSQGETDIQDYYTSFIKPFEKGRIEPQFRNHSLASAIYKASQLYTEVDGHEYNFRLVSGVSIETTYLIYRISFLVLFSMMVFMIIRNRYLKLPVSVYELSVVFLAMLLLCGITWEYHLITMLFVFMALITMKVNVMNKASNFFRWFFIFLAGLLALIGRDTVGDRIFHYSGGYSLLTVLMLGLMVFFFFFDIYGQGNVITGS